MSTGCVPSQTSKPTNGETSKQEQSIDQQLALTALEEKVGKETMKQFKV